MMRFATQAEFDAFLKSSHARPHGAVASIPPVGRTKPAPERSPIEAQLSEQIRLEGLPAPIEWPDQLMPVKGRRFRADFAWPEHKLICEVDGAVHRIKHSFKASFERGYQLLRAGWRVLHVGGDEVRDGIAVVWIRELLRAKTPLTVQVLHLLKKCPARAVEIAAELGASEAVVAATLSNLRKDGCVSSPGGHCGRAHKGWLYTFEHMPAARRERGVCA